MNKSLVEASPFHKDDQILFWGVRCFLFRYLLLKFKNNLLVGKLVVYGSIDVGSSLNVSLVSGVEVDLCDSLSISLYSGSLSGDLGRVDNIIQDSVLNGSQCSGARARSAGLLVTGISLSEDGALGNEHNDLSRELLLELSDKLLVNLVHGFQKLVRNVEDDGGAATSTVDLLGSCDVNVSERSLELGRSHFEVEELIGNLGLESVRFLLIEDMVPNYKRATKVFMRLRYVFHRIAPIVAIVSTNYSFLPPSSYLSS